MITTLKYTYAPVINTFSKKIAHDLLPSAELKLSTLKNDTFIKTKLSVPLCAESFFIRPLFAKTIKELSKKDIYALNFSINPIEKKIMVKNNPKLMAMINDFVQKFPEAYYLFRPKTKEPDLAQHVISTLRQVLIHPEFEALSKREQNILQISALLHDVGKALVSMPEHAEVSSKMVARRLDKINMNSVDKNLIVKIIDNHHYTYHIKKKHSTYAQYAKVFSEKEFKLLKILAEADLKSKKLNLKNIRRILENKIIFKNQLKEYKK